jgi:hypothetical protein
VLCTDGGLRQSYFALHPLALHPDVLPEQFPIPLHAATDHLDQADAVGKSLHVGIISTRCDEAWVYEGRQSIVS